MRRLLRDIAEGRELGNVHYLADPTIVESLQEQFNQEPEARLIKRVWEYVTEYRK